MIHKVTVTGRSSERTVYVLHEVHGSIVSALEARGFGTDSVAKVDAWANRPVMFSVSGLFEPMKGASPHLMLLASTKEDAEAVIDGLRLKFPNIHAEITEVKAPA
jgi:hypothetical protein